MWLRRSRVQWRLGGVPWSAGPACFPPLDPLGHGSKDKCYERADIEDVSIRSCHHSITVTRPSSASPTHEFMPVFLLLNNKIKLAHAYNDSLLSGSENGVLLMYCATCHAAPSLPKVSYIRQPCAIHVNTKLTFLYFGKKRMYVGLMFIWKCGQLLDFDLIWQKLRLLTNENESYRED